MIRTGSSFESVARGELLLISVRGEIDHHNAVTLRSGIDAQIYENHPKKLALDLDGVDFMDSSGLGLIMGRYSVMKELGGETVIVDPSDNCMKMISLAGLERIVRIEKLRERNTGSKIKKEKNNEKTRKDSEKNEKNLNQRI